MRTKLFSIQFLDKAEVDFDKSYKFYAEVNPKVADNFFNEINLSLENIKQKPKTFPIS